MAPAERACEDEALTATLEEHAKLRRELGRLDVVLFLLSAMVVVDTLGAVAVGEGQAITWLVVLAITFFVPSALISAELGAAIPDEGGAYVWCRMAFGRSFAALVSLLYWAGTPLWLGGSVTAVAVAVVDRFVAPLSRPGLLAFGAIFILVATLAAVAPLRWGKWVPSSGAIGQGVLLAFFTLSVVIYAIGHGVHGIDGLDLGSFAPTWVTFIAVAPVLLYSFVGVELPSTAGEEMKDPRRDVPVAIARAGIGVMAFYAIPVIAIILVLPPARISTLHGLIDALRTVLTVYGGHVAADGQVVLEGAGAVLGQLVAILFVWVLCGSGAAWIMGAGRAQAAACLDGGGPRVLGRISGSTGTPVPIILVSGVLALAVMAFDVIATGGDAQRYFSAALTLAIALIVMAYVGIFPAFVRLRYALPNLPRPFVAPGGIRAAWLIAGLATAWSLFATVSLLWPGLGMEHPDAALPQGFAGRRDEFEFMVLAPLALLILVWLAFLAVGRRTQPDAAIELPLETVPELEVTAP